MIGFKNSYYRQLATVTALVVAIIVSYMISIHSNNVLAASGFRNGNIIDDAVMADKDSMSESQIQQFLKSKNNCHDTNLEKAKRWMGRYNYHIKDGHFVCMSDDNFNGESAAHIIWQAAQDYSINPKVIMILLEKEQSLVTDTWPNDNQYQMATGFGCPDTAPCDKSFAGLKSQIRKAAKLFRDVLNGGWSGYPAGKTVNIYYHPNVRCGSKSVYVENRATSALYRYTPYIPNRAAIAAGTGLGDSCSSYGNRNFYNLFTNWFGSTHINNSLPISKRIQSGYQESGGYNNLGNPVLKEICGLKQDACYQKFEKGSIYYIPNKGSHAVKGLIFKAWIDQGLEHGFMGYPMSPEIKSKGVIYQIFEGGRIYYTRHGTHLVHGAIGNEYVDLGAENSNLGIPTSNEICGLKNNGCYQKFENGNIYWTEQIGAHPVWMGIYDKFSHNRYENFFGYPISREIKISNGVVQKFENGNIYWNKDTESNFVKGAILEKYIKEGAPNSRWGWPIGDEVCNLVKNGCLQKFQKGSIYWREGIKAQVIYGEIGNKWLASGAEKSNLGYPLTPEVCSNIGCYRDFEGGSIYWVNNRVAYIVSGPISDKYKKIGRGESFIGLPTMDTHCGLIKDGCYQNFSKRNASIYWTPATKAHILRDGMKEAWVKNSFEWGKLGYPVDDEHPYRNGALQNFEGGSIYWTNDKPRISTT